MLIDFLNDVATGLLLGLLLSVPVFGRENVALLLYLFFIGITGRHLAYNGFVFVVALVVGPLLEFLWPVWIVS